MRSQVKTAALLAVTSLCLAGTRPRANPSDYKAHETHDGLTLAAEIVPAKQIKSIFSTDLRGYVVVEVAVYPGNSMDLASIDFLLRAGANEAIRPASPRAIPRVVQDRTAPRKSDIDIYPSATIGYESGPYHHGVYTAAGVGVATGGDPRRIPPPASTDPDRRTMQLELEEKGLPEGPAARPVAGYLYFPFPANKQKTVVYELEYNGPSGRIRLALP